MKLRQTTVSWPTSIVLGELSQSEYKANDGATKTSLELNATIVDLIGKKSESEANT